MKILAINMLLLRDFLIDIYLTYTNPVNPKNANDSKPATNKLIGTPCIPFGKVANSNCSLILAKTINASAKPIELAIAKKAAFKRLPLSNPKAKIATPRTAQLVVIKGKNTPSAW